MNSAQQFLIKGLEHIESSMGNRTFVWLVNNNTYPCIGSIIDYKRELETGGFTVDKLLTLTVRQYDSLGNSVFPNNVFPKSQDRLMYNNDNFRISSVNLDTIGTGARFRIFAVSTGRGIKG